MIGRQMRLLDFVASTALEWNDASLEWPRSSTSWTWFMERTLLYTLVLRHLLWPSLHIGRTITRQSHSLSQPSACYELDPEGIQ